MCVNESAVAALSLTGDNLHVESRHVPPRRTCCAVLTVSFLSVWPPGLLHSCCLALEVSELPRVNHICTV